MGLGSGQEGLVKEGLIANLKPLQRTYIQCVGESYGALAHINMQGGAP